MNSTTIADKDWKFLWQKEKESSAVIEWAPLSRKYIRALQGRQKKNSLHLQLQEEWSQLGTGPSG